MLRAQSGSGEFNAISISLVIPISFTKLSDPTNPRDLIDLSKRHPNHNRWLCVYLSTSSFSCRPPRFQQKCPSRRVQIRRRGRYCNANTHRRCDKNRNTNCNARSDADAKCSTDTGSRWHRYGHSGSFASADHNANADDGADPYKDPNCEENPCKTINPHATTKAE